MLKILDLLVGILSLLIGVIAIIGGSLTDPASIPIVAFLVLSGLLLLRHVRDGRKN